MNSPSRLKLLAGLGLGAVLLWLSQPQLMVWAFASFALLMGLVVAYGGAQTKIATLQQQLNQDQSNQAQVAVIVELLMDFNGELLFADNCGDVNLQVVASEHPWPFEKRFLIQQFEHWNSLIHRDDLGAYQQAFESFKQSSQRQMKNQYRLCIAPEDPLLVEELVVAILDCNSKVQGVIRSIRLLTKMAESNDKSEVSLSEEKMEALVKLSDCIVHDHNNILGIITGYVELLELDNELSSHATGYLNEITIAIERTKRLNEKLLEFSRRRKTGQSMLDFEQAVLPSILSFKAKVDNNIQLDWLLAKTNAQVRLDPKLLAMTVRELGDNAIKAMPQGGTLRFVSEVKSVSVDVARGLNINAGEYLVFEVIDNGCGIAEPILTKVLEPYFSTTKGEGLGLSRVYGFIKSCEGTIALESTVEQGTKIMLYFPLLKS